MEREEYIKRKEWIKGLLSNIGCQSAAENLIQGKDNAIPEDVLDDISEIILYGIVKENKQAVFVGACMAIALAKLNILHEDGERIGLKGYIRENYSGTNENNVLSCLEKIGINEETFAKINLIHLPAFRRVAHDIGGSAGPQFAEKINNVLEIISHTEIQTRPIVKLVVSISSRRERAQLPPMDREVLSRKALEHVRGRLLDKIEFYLSLVKEGVDAMPAGIYFNLMRMDIKSCLEIGISKDDRVVKLNHLLYEHTKEQALGNDDTIDYTDALYLLFFLINSGVEQNIFRSEVRGWINSDKVHKNHKGYFYYALLIDQIQYGEVDKAGDTLLQWMEYDRNGIKSERRDYQVEVTIDLVIELFRSLHKKGFDDTDRYVVYRFFESELEHYSTEEKKRYLRKILTLDNSALHVDHINTIISKLSTEQIVEVWDDIVGHVDQQINMLKDAGWRVSIYYHEEKGVPLHIASISSLPVLSTWSEYASLFSVYLEADGIQDLVRLLEERTTTATYNSFWARDEVLNITKAILSLADSHPELGSTLNLILENEGMDARLVEFIRAFIQLQQVETRDQVKEIIAQNSSIQFNEKIMIELFIARRFTIEDIEYILSETTVNVERLVLTMAREHFEDYEHKLELRECLTRMFSVGTVRKAARLVELLDEIGYAIPLDVFDGSAAYMQFQDSLTELELTGFNGTPEELAFQAKSSFRRLSRRYHPDVSDLPEKVAVTKFQDLNAAYNHIKRSIESVVNDRSEPWWE